MTGLDVIDASNLLRHLCRVDLLSKHGKGRATYYLPSERFFESLPTGVISPGFEGKTSMSGAKPSMSDGKPSMSGTKPSMSDGKSHMSGTKSHMSDGKSHMLPAHIEGMIDQLGGKADDAAMREAIINLCRWTPVSASELGERLERTPNYLGRRYLKPMVAEGLLALTIPDKPRSRNQKYRAVDEEEKQV